LVRSIDDLRALVRMLRDERVRRVRWGEVELELLPDEPITEVEQSIEESHDPEEYRYAHTRLRPPNLRELREKAR
jgi:hypothetical protein